jgi:uncharacterized membrane protein
MNFLKNIVKRTNSRNFEWLCVCVILLTATFLRLWNIQCPLMWQDEISTIGCATAQYTGYEDTKHFPENIIIKKPYNTASINSAESIIEVWRFFAGGDVNPPLYYTIFYFIRYLLGDSYFSIRILSTISSILSVLIIYIIGKKLFNKWTGFCAALLMCLSAPQIIYSYEVKQYAFMIFLGLCAMLALIQIEQNGVTRGRIFIFTALLLSLSLTHYFSFGFLFGLAIYCIIRFRGNNLVWLSAAFLASALLFVAIWGYGFYQTFFGANFINNNWGNFRQNANMVTYLPALLDAWPRRILFDVPVEIKFMPIYFAVVCLLPFVAIFWKPNLLLPWILIFCTVGFVTLLDLFRETYHMSQIRYTLLAAPCAYLLISAGVFNGNFHRLLNSIVPAAISVFLILEIKTAFKPYKEDWFEMASILKQGSPTDTVLLPHIGAKNQLYWPQLIWTALGLYDYNPDRPMAFLTKPLTQEMMQQIGWGKQAWIFTRIPEFPQATDTRWPSLWVPGCKINGAWAFPNRAVVYYITLPHQNESVK